MSEHQSKILCEICGGWHPTEAHEQIQRTSEANEPEQEDHRLKKELVELESEAGRGRLIENKSLGVSYLERTVKLPTHRQRESGISAIRTKRIVEMPTHASKPELYGEYDERYHLWSGEQNLKNELFYHLTEGRFPSFRHWNHVLGGDIVQGKASVSRHKSEGLFFQEVIPFEAFESGGTSIRTYKTQKSVFFKADQGIIRPIPLAEGFEVKSDGERKKFGLKSDALLAYDMSFGTGSDAYSWTTKSPMYVFGKGNSNFVDYAHSLFTNPDVKKMLEYNGWIFEPPMQLEKYDSPSQKKWDEGLSAPVPPDRALFPEKKIWDVPGMRIGHHIDQLKFLIEGNAVKYDTKNFFSHPLLPIVRHPSIRPLRWCHAEMAILGTEDDPSALVFFEQ
jgi:hypothetical protein